MDDGFLFFRSQLNEAQVNKHILDDYAYASGQLINLYKLEVTYRNNADLTLESLLASTLGVNESSG